MFELLELQVFLPPLIIDSSFSIIQETENNSYNNIVPIMN